MIKVSIEGVDAVRLMTERTQRAVRAAAVGALNDLAFEANKEIKNQMMSKFGGGATRYTLASFRVKKAVADDLTAVVALRTDAPAKGSNYHHTLAHQFTGGSRKFKRMEGAFRRIGVLNSGDIMVVPNAVSWANPLDAFGNPKRSLVVRLISYFGAFGEQGYKANMTGKKKRALAKFGKTEVGLRTIGGVQYFISRGKGNWFGGGSWAKGRSQHLPAGIWAKRGLHGVDVVPVFLFVRSANYRQMINLDEIGNEVVSSRWSRQFDRWLAFKTKGMA